MVTLNIKSVTSMPPEAAIGQQAGAVNQGSQAIAVGKQAGYQNQGANAIAIGAYAGYQNQAAGSIVLNASGANVNATTSGFYVNPVRSVTSSSGLVSYTSNEMIVTSNVIMNTVTATAFVGNGSQLTGVFTPMTISNVQITSNTWTVLDDTAVSTTDAGYCLVNGSGFAPGSMVRFGTDLAPSVAYVSSNQLRTTVPAKTSGSYDVTVIRGDTVTATLALGITYSATPVWGTAADLGNVTQNIAFTRTLAASSDSNVTYANITTLPPQTTLATNGTLSGNITSVAVDTTYTFGVKATDLELQDVPRTFSLQYFLAFIARKLVANDKAASDQFGWSVAMSSDGSRVIVGALYANYADPGGTSDAGAAYVFIRSGTTWTQESKLTASDKAANDYFGSSVSISSDGSRVIVGAPLASPGGTTNAGAAYIYTRSGTTWTQESKLTASDKAAGDQFGDKASVSMSSDGSRVIIGAYYASVGGTSNAGAAYVYTRSGTTWTQESKLTASDKAANDSFGYSVSMSSDGSRVIVGARYADPGGTTDAGAAYVFIRSGTTWTQESKLTASDKAANDYFGSSVSISSDGSRVIVGALYADPGGTSNAGAAYVCGYSGGTWVSY
jgi:hypothetical protein